MPKNWVVTMSPASPYPSGRPHSAGRGSKAPRGCLSNPTASAMSAAPARIALTAENNALPPVAQPFLTLVNGIPVRPKSATRVSARPDPSLPPKATWTSGQVSPASSSACTDRGDRHLTPGDARLPTEPGQSGADDRDILRSLARSCYSGGADGEPRHR